MTDTPLHCFLTTLSMVRAMVYFLQTAATVIFLFAGSSRGLFPRSVACQRLKLFEAGQFLLTKHPYLPWRVVTLPLLFLHPLTIRRLRSAVGAIGLVVVCRSERRRCIGETRQAVLGAFLRPPPSVAVPARGLQVDHASGVLS